MKRMLRQFLRLLSMLAVGALPAALWAESPTALEFQPPLPEPPAAHRGLMPPPENVISQEMNGKLYASGDIYVICHADTAALKKYGFREFEFLGHSVGTIRYHAVWPLAIDANALPAGLSGLNYAADPPRNEAYREYVHAGYSPSAVNPYYSSATRRGRSWGSTSNFSYGYSTGST